MALSIAAAALLAARVAWHGSMNPRFNNGPVKLYNGTRPASVAVAVSTQTLLATAVMPATAFPTATAQANVSNDPAPVTAAAPGTATWGRAFESDGTTAIMDFDVGAAGGSAELGLTVDGVATNVIPSGASVNLGPITLNAP